MTALTREQLEQLRAEPPWGLELIIRPLCEAILAARSGHPWPEKTLARLQQSARSWLWCDSGMVALLMGELDRPAPTLIAADLKLSYSAPQPNPKPPCRECASMLVRQGVAKH